jgi:hypothetical protein
MKLALFQELLDLNQAFEQVIRGLTKLEKVRAFSTEQIRRVRAEVETARVDANREFFDNFDAIVEDDASWAYKFQRKYDRKTKDLDDVYFDIKDAEERRKKKGLPPRVAILPGWDVSDEDRYDEEQAEKKKRAARKERSRPSSRPVLGEVKSGRRRPLLSDRKGRPRDEKEEKASGDTSERFAQTWEAVSRRARQDRGLGRTRFRGRDDVRAGALHG